MYKNLNRIIFLIIVFAFIPIHAVNQSNIDTYYIDWQKGYIISKGRSGIKYEKEGIPVDTSSGKAVSINKARIAIYNDAKEIAIENMIKAIKSLRLDPQNSLYDIIKNNTITQKKISNRILKSIIHKEYPVDFDSSICETRLNFGDIISSIPYDFPTHDFPTRAKIPISTPYTSLIVDCRGHNIKPMLFPSIYSDIGLEIYGKHYIESSFAVNGGMVSYCYNEDQALRNDRAGEHPYFAAAIKSIKDCPVLSEKDVRRILSSKKTRNNLKKCRVILIIDKG